VTLAWKRLFTPLFDGFLGAHFPQKMSLIVLTPKRTVLGLNHVIWAIKREYRPRGSSWALEREKRTGQHRKKSQNDYIFNLFGQKPHSGDLHQKLCSRWSPRRNHVCQVSKWNFHGLPFYRGRGSNFPFSYVYLNGPYKCCATALPVIQTLLLCHLFLNNLVHDSHNALHLCLLNVWTYFI